MDDFQYYNYELLRTMVSSKKPFNNHLCVEASNGDFYFVDLADQTHLLCTKDKGVTLTTNGDFDDSTFEIGRTQKIQGMFYDRTNEYIWFVDCNNSSTTFDVWYLDLSDDTITEVDTFTTVNTVSIYDIFEISAGKMYVVGREFIFNGGIHYWITVWRVDTAPIVEMNDKDVGVGFTDIGKVVVVGTIAYFIAEYVVNFVEILQYTEDGTIATAFSMGNGYNIPSENQKAISYDGNDFLYFVLLDRGNSNARTLYSYSISGDVVTSLSVNNLALMLDRNNAKVHPSKHEKAFHLTNQEIYQLRPAINNYVIPQGFAKISTIKSSNTMIAITDSYLIDSEAQLYEFKNMSSVIHDLEIRHDTRAYPECVFHLDTNKADFILDHDAIVQFYDNYTSREYGLGCYNDSLNFKDETIGSAPSDTSQGTWLDNSGGDCAVYMIDKNNGHSNIIQFEDYDNTNNAELYFTFTSAQTDGSIEYWYMTTDPTYQFGFFCYDEGVGLAAGIHQYDDLWYYWDDNVAWQAMGGTAPVVGKWYRITITFDCGTDKVTYTIVDEDDVAIANADNKNMASTPTTINKIWLFTRDANLNYLIFIDAIGFTWDTDYILGDNANLISKIQEDHTIFYGAVIKKDSRKYKEYRCRTLAYEMTYIEPDQTETGFAEENLAELIIDNTTQVQLTAYDEIFRATYNFINDTDETTPMGIVIEDAGTGTSLIETASIGGHKNTLRQINNGGGNCEVKIFFEGQTNGTIEWYMRTSNTTLAVQFIIRNGTDIVIQIAAINDKIRSFYTGAWHDLLDPALDNIWYRVRVDFECGAGGYLDVDGNVLAADTTTITVYNDATSVELGQLTQVPFRNVTANIDNTYIICQTVNTAYWDAIGFSWDKRYPEYVDYAIGDNQYLLYQYVEPTGDDYDLVTTGDKAIDNFNNAIADEDLKQWYLKLEDEVYAFALNNGAFDSTVDIEATDDIFDMDAIEQMERINKVVLDGGLGTTPQTAENLDNIATFGERIFTDTYAHIRDNDELLIIAQNVLARKIAAPQKVSIMWKQTIYGMLQCGETITLGAGIPLIESDETITPGQYIIHAISYFPESSLIQLILTDGLIFEKSIASEI